jgi:Fe-S-cluster containining protein
MPHLLDNYKQLIAKIDAICRRIESALGEQITCSGGCSSCCTAITIFPVEAAALRDALNALPEQEAESIRQHVAQNASGERCPLLSHQHCLLYSARPIICRTHGLPITYSEEHQQKSDCCPLNMTETETISGNNVIDLDRLNAMLVAVNSLYLSQSEEDYFPERLTIAEAIKKGSSRTTEQLSNREIKRLNQQQT